MRCPNDNTELVVTEREEIDMHSCPTCHGAWLERGKLDEIVSRSISRFDNRRDDDFPDSGNRPTAAAKPRRRRDKYSEFDDDRPRKTRRKDRQDVHEDAYDY